MGRWLPLFVASLASLGMNAADVSKGVHRAPVLVSSGGALPTPVLDAADRCFLLGLEADDRGEDEEALRQYRQAIALRGYHAGAYYYAGLIRQERGQLRMARYNFRQAMADPEYRERSLEQLARLGRVLTRAAAQAKKGSYSPSPQAARISNALDRNDSVSPRSVQIFTPLSLNRAIAEGRNSDTIAAQPTDAGVAREPWRPRGNPLVMAFAFVAVTVAGFVPFVVLAWIASRRKRSKAKSHKPFHVVMLNELPRDEVKLTYSLSDLHKGEEGRQWSDSSRQTLASLAADGTNESTSPRPSRQKLYERVQRLATEGVADQEIARRLGITHGEVQLALQLKKKPRQRRTSSKPASNLRFRLAY